MLMGRKWSLAFVYMSGLLLVWGGIVACGPSKTSNQASSTSLLSSPEGAVQAEPIYNCLHACWSGADFVLYSFAERVMAAGAAPEHWELAEGPTPTVSPGSKEAWALRYVEGLQLLAKGEDAEARVLFAEVAPHYPEMASHAWYRAGLAATRTQHWEEAVEALSQVEAPFRFYADAQFLLARAYTQQRRFREAIQTLEPLAQRPAGLHGRAVGAEALWQLHQVAEVSKNRSLSQKALLQLWSEHPLHAFAARAGKSLGAKQLSLEAKVKRAETLIRLHRNQEGHRLLEKYKQELKLPDPLACQAAFSRGRALRKMRKHSAAIETFNALLEKCEDAELRHLGSFNLFYSQSIVALGDALDTAERFVQQFATSHLADDVLISQARIWMRQGNVEKALKTLERLIESYPDGDMVMDALFLRFWYARKQGDMQAARERVAQLEKGAREKNRAEDLWRALFWRGQLALEMGEEAARKQAWQQLLHEGPLSFYAGRVRAREGAWTSHFPKEYSAEYVFSQSALQKFPAWASALELWKMGLWSEVAPELLSIPRAELDEDGLLLMAELLLQAEAGEAAFSVLWAMWVRGFHPQPRIARHYWVLAYPLAFRQEVEQASQEAGLSNPNLVQAVMREESACNPQALSWAGARGLMQLMPGTANDVARRLGLKRPSAQELLRPELNLRLGATYLAGLLKRFEEEPVYALAAYNAGSTPVVRWQTRNNTGMLEEWVEDIPLDETRNYIKRVLSSFEIYEWLYPDFRVLGSDISAELL